MKKRYGLMGYGLASLTELCLLAGAYAVNHFTVRKIGMVRFVNYHTMRLEKAYPMAQLVMAAVVVLILMAAAAAFLYGKRKRSLKRTALLMVVTAIVLSIGTALFAILCSKAVTRAYYFIFALISLAAAIQNIKTLVCILYAQPKKA